MCASYRKLFKEVFCFFYLLFAPFFAFSGFFDAFIGHKFTYSINDKSDSIRLKLNLPEELSSKSLNELLETEDIGVQEKIKIIGCIFEKKNASKQLKAYCCKIIIENLKIGEINSEFLEKVKCRAPDIFPSLFEGLLNRSSLRSIKVFFDTNYGSDFADRCEIFWKQLFKEVELTTNTDSFGIWPSNNMGKNLKKACDDLLCFPKPIFVAKHYELKIAYNKDLPKLPKHCKIFDDIFDLPNHCKISDGSFNFAEEEIYFQNGEPYVEVTSFAVFPNPEEIEKLQYKQEASKSFFIKDSNNENDQSIRLLGDSEAVGQQLAVLWQNKSLSEMSPPAKTVLFWQDSRSFDRKDNLIKFFPENSSLEESKHLFIGDSVELEVGNDVKERNRKIKILNVIYFYPSEYLTVERYKTFRKEKLEKYDSFFDDFMHFIQDWLNKKFKGFYYTPDYTSDQMKIINEKLDKMYTDYKNDHIIPYDFIRRPIAFINSLIRENEMKALSLIELGEDFVKEESDSRQGFVEEIEEDESVEEKELKEACEDEEVTAQESLEEKEIRKELEEKERLAKIEAEKKAKEEAERKAEEERRQKEAEEQKQKEIEEQKRKQEEAEKARKEAELKAKQEEELKRKQEEEARVKAEEEQKRLAEERIRKEAEEQKRKQEEAEKARKEAELKAKQEEELKRKQEEEARVKAEEEQKRLEEAEVRKAEEERIRKEEEEKKRKQEEERIRKQKEAEEQKQKEIEEQKRLEEEARKAAEEQQRLEQERKAKEEAENKAKKERERKEAELKTKQEEERKQKEAEEQKRKQEELKRQQEEAEKQKCLAEEKERKQKEIEQKRLEEKQSKNSEKVFTMQEIVDKAQEISTPLRKNTISRLISAGKINLNQTVNNKSTLNENLHEAFDKLTNNK